MKKILFSLICAFAMSMTAFAATETTVYYAIPDATVGTYTVKLNVCLQWDKPDPNKEPVAVWQQFDMQKTDKTFNANPIYKVTFTDLWDGANTMQFQLYDGEQWKSQEVAFDGSSNGEWTTADTYNGKMRVFGTDGWQAYQEDGAVTPDPKTVTLYYVNTNKWENVNAYVWYNDGSDHAKADWAGEAMTKTEDQVNGFDVYSYTFAETYTKVIFNDGDKNQTTDLTWNAAEPYFYGDKWYAALKDIPAEGGETPTPDFGIMVNDKDYYAGVKNEEYKDAGTEYVVTITLAVNDKFKNYDNVNKAAWQVALDGAGYQFTSDEGYYVVTEAGEYTFYIKIIGEGKDNMFVAKKSEVVSTPDFGIMVNDNDYYAGVKNDEYDKEGTEYIVTVTLAVDDKFTNYDNVAKAAWLVALDDAGYKFNAVDNHYVVTEAGEYTFYIKIIGEGKDNMFVSLKKEITRVDYVLNNAGELANDGAKLFVHTWGDGMADEDILMTEVKDVDAVVGYKAEINTLTQYLVFVRMNPEAEAIDLSNNWGKSGDHARCESNNAYFTGWNEATIKVSCDAAVEITRVDYTLNNAGELANDGAKLFVHTWGDNMADEDILMTEVKDGDAVVGYKAAINDLTQYLVFVRMYPEAEAIVWEGENKYWNKSDDLARCVGNQAYFTGWEGDIFKVSCDEPTGFETIEQDVENGKVIYDGVLYIIRDGKRYNAQGVEVK